MPVPDFLPNAHGRPRRRVESPACTPGDEPGSGRARALYAPRASGLRIRSPCQIHDEHPEPMTPGRASKILEKVQILGSATITFLPTCVFSKNVGADSGSGLDFSPADSPLADKIRPHLPPEHFFSRSSAIKPLIFELKMFRDKTRKTYELRRHDTSIRTRSFLRFSYHF